jgi:hypothetical protein
MPAKRSFIDATDTPADFVVGSEHGISVTWSKETEHCLKRLDMSGA